MKQTRLAAIITCSMACCLGGIETAQAQPVGVSVSSIEWAAADSCVIVRGVIEKAIVHKLADGLFPDQKIRCYQTLTVRVLETLKGKHAPRLEFVHDGDFVKVDVSDLLTDQEEVLLFLNPWTRSHRFSRSQGGYAYSRFPLLAEKLLVLDPENAHWAHTDSPILTHKRESLTTPEETIDAIKSYLKSRQQTTPPEAVTVELPAQFLGGAAFGSFTYPADVKPRTKTQAMDFEAFEKKFSKKPPADKKPPYLRKSKGYVGVYALELMAGDCDAIVRGRVEDFCFISRTDDPTGDGFGVKIRVTEAFKGPEAKEITCFISDSRDLEMLRRDKTELILFLRTNESRARSEKHPEWALEYRTRAGLWDDSVIVLEKSEAEVLFADMTWHKEPEEILARLREFLKSAKPTETPACQYPAPPVFDLHPPSSLTEGSSIAGNPYAIVYLPVDAELEQNARKWALSNNKDLRWMSARAMIYFKSDKNAAVLKKLLVDDSTWDRREMLAMTGLAHPHRPQYLIRWEAWHVLSGWGYELDPVEW